MFLLHEFLNALLVLPTPQSVLIIIFQSLGDRMWLPLAALNQRSFEAISCMYKRDTFKVYII